MRAWFHGLLALLLTVAGAPAHAKVVRDLYRAQTVVTGTEEPERTRGFRDTLLTVVTKLTGNAKLANEPRILALAGTPHRLVETFEYEDRMKDIPVHDEQGTRERPHYLRVTFSKAAIDDALQRLGIKAWPPDRPVIAVWLGIDTPAGQFVLVDSGPAGYGQRAVITETAEKLGLPIELPGASHAIVTFDDIAGIRVDAMRAAAPRAHGHLIGRLTVRTDGYWDIAWSLHAPNASKRWTLTHVTFDQALKQGLVNTTATLSGSTGP